MNEQKSPLTNIHCRLIGTDGNIFALTSKVRESLRRGGHPELVKPLTDEVMNSKSYEEALAVLCRYVIAE